MKTIPSVFIHHRCVSVNPKFLSVFICGKGSELTQKAGASMKTLSLLIFLLLGLAASSVQAQNPDRSQPPTLGPPPTLKLKPIQHLKLSNGLPVMLYEKHEVPLVQMNLVFPVGRTSDPAARLGLAAVTAAASRSR